MNILVDNAMPYWQEYFSPKTFDSCSELISFRAGDLAVNDKKQIANADLQAKLASIDALLIRSTTKVNEHLLSLMPRLKFVATATAGYDHLDISAIESRNICWHAAGGCNAQAVAQYVTCAILHLASADNFIIADKTIAIVGHGNVGKTVALVLRAFGAKLVIYDPPQAALLKAFEQVASLRHARGDSDELKNSHAEPLRANSDVHYASFDEVVKADIICMHAPYNSHAQYPSFHLFNKEVLAKLTPNQYLINAGRGELIDNHALLSLFEQNESKGLKSVQVVLDVWENEPDILQALVKHLRFATAHIAGHTLEGKARGTHIVYEHLCRFKQLESAVTLEDLLPKYEQQIDITLMQELSMLDEDDHIKLQAWLKKLCDCVYLIQNDDSVFRASVAQSNGFATIRREYPIRREFSVLDIKTPNKNISKLMRDLGFIISNGS
jgi:erythronate-4-phosphate dehydrogenase